MKMPWEYVCDNCGHEMYPEEGEIEKCRICGAPVEGNKVSSLSQAVDVLKKHKEKLQKEAEESPPKLGKFENGNLVLETQDGEFAGSIEEVEEVSLTIPGGEIGRLKNPEYAEFPKIFDVKQNGETVELKVGSEQEKEREFIEKIDRLKEETSKEMEKKEKITNK